MVPRLPCAAWLALVALGPLCRGHAPPHSGDKDDVRLLDDEPGDADDVRLLDEEFGEVRMLDEEPEEEEGPEQPAQMTEEWWDLHYDVVFEGRNITTDPRRSGDSSRGDIFGTDLNDREHFEAALAISEAALRHEREAAKASGRPGSGGALDVVVVGCGLSPLVFALADRGGAALRVRCLEISPRLLGHLRGAARSLPRPPSFELGDVAALGAAAEPGAGEAPALVASADLVIDENVLDGMGCTFPPEAGAERQRLALAGMARLLRPQGALLTLSFLPLERQPAGALFGGAAPWRCVGGFAPPLLGDPPAVPLSAGLWRRPAE